MEGGKKVLPEIRRDWVTNRWVIFSPARAKRPSDFKSKSPVGHEEEQSNSCPFCLGREHHCAPEIFRVPPDDPNWKLRVIQNLYPALSRDVTPPPADETPGQLMTGFGFHDVVIETPLHSLHLSHLPPSQIALVLGAYTTRILHFLSDHPSIKYVQVFKNHGASAGASLTHSHSQIMALPFLPPAVAARLHSMKDYFNRTGKCSLCEFNSNDLLIHQSPHFVAIVPYAATFPFEMWIIPLAHSPHFHELNAHKAVDLGGILKLMLGKMALQLNNPPFNFMIQTSPLRDSASELPHSHWFLQIIPQLSVAAGFEIGTGCYINPVFPEDAAKVLREVNVLPSEGDD